MTDVTALDPDRVTPAKIPVDQRAQHIRDAALLVEAPLTDAMDEAGRQMKKWRRTLDWLADR